MALQFNRTDADTGHQWTVYAKIDKATVIFGADTTALMNLYDSVGAARSGLKPVLPPDPITLTSGEMSAPNSSFVTDLAAAAHAGSITSPQDALLTALYTLIKQRPAYTSAQDV